MKDIGDDKCKPMLEINEQSQQVEAHANANSNGA